MLSMPSWKQSSLQLSRMEKGWEGLEPLGVFVYELCHWGCALAPALTLLLFCALQEMFGSMFHSETQTAL